MVIVIVIVKDDQFHITKWWDLLHHGHVLLYGAREVVLFGDDGPY